MQPIIEVNHISKRYGRTEALRDVSLSVKRGELFGLIAHLPYPVSAIIPQ